MLTRTQILTIVRPALFVGAAAILALPAQASAPSAVVALAEAASFDASFDNFDALPSAPEPVGNVVDIDTIEPPVEIEQPAPAADASSGRSLGSGVASYYGRKFQGRRTASGESFNMNAMTAAHKKLPFGSKVRVTNPRNGKSVVVRINDRGPYAHGREIDLSKAAAQEIGIVSRGHGTVQLELL